MELLGRNLKRPIMSLTPEELEDVSDLEEDHEVRSHASIQTEGKTDRNAYGCIGNVELKQKPTNFSRFLLLRICIRKDFGLVYYDRKPKSECKSVFKFV
ncbi:hypothetical protein STEG23_034400 [Scotinomys teguina]